MRKIQLMKFLSFFSICNAVLSCIYPLGIKSIILFFKALHLLFIDTKNMYGIETIQKLNADYSSVASVKRKPVEATNDRDGRECGNKEGGACSCDCSVNDDSVEKGRKSCGLCKRGLLALEVD